MPAYRFSLGLSLFFRSSLHPADAGWDTFRAGGTHPSLDLSQSGKESWSSGFSSCFTTFISSPIIKTFSPSRAGRPRFMIWWPRWYSVFPISFPTTRRGELDQSRISALEELSAFLRETVPLLDTPAQARQLEAAQQLLNRMSIPEGRIRIFCRSLLHMLILLLPNAGSAISATQGRPSDQLGRAASANPAPSLSGIL